VAVRAAGGEAHLTRADHATGTERIAELAAVLPPASLVLNVQGDEPLVAPELLRDLVTTLRGAPEMEMLTAAHAASDAAGFASPHVVKVVCDGVGRALYFSRTGIPHARGVAPEYWRHVGVYAFRRAALTRFVAWQPGPLELREGLEQLRALEHGMPIHVLRTTHESCGIDTPADLEAVARRLGRA
jgi:3-deoxy-manno-octulosonate cytidylyltransferase (CMP-KDO synthetase)